MSVPLARRKATAPLNVRDLPSDVLTDIFSYFQHEYLDSYGRDTGCDMMRDEALERQRDLQNARLVCRVFCKFASPYLFPVLKLPLEKCSLDIINSILGSPCILEGIRVIEVSTLYRPKELAQSLALFKQRRLADLDQRNHMCSYYAETWFLGGYASDDESVCELPKKAYEDAMYNYRSICSAWSRTSDCDNTELEDDEAVEYQRILQRGHAEYRKKQEEQMQMITDGSFVNAITMLVSRTPAPCSLHFTDDTRYISELMTFEPTRLLTDKDALSRFMPTPHDWRTIESLGGGSDIMTATLLAALPVAIQQSGASLQGVQTTCFPLLSGHFGICGTSRQPLWDDLDASCKQLKSFVFRAGGGYKDIRHNHIQGEDKACIDRYVRAMLSSPCIESIGLDFRPFGLTDGRNEHTLLSRDLNMSMGSVISRTQYSLLRRASISHVSMKPIELERFCDGLGKRVQMLYFYDVELSGTWAGALKILREKLSSRCLEGRCRIIVNNLFGGEFGPRPLREEHKWGQPFRMPDVPLIITQAQEYVNGSIEVTEFPMRS